MARRRKEHSLDEKTELVTDVIHRMSAHLEPMGGELQGAVLCQLVALWVAGHYIEENAAKSVIYREGILQRFVGQVRHTLPGYIKTIEAIRKTEGKA
jgi:hypothetical protein